MIKIQKSFHGRGKVETEPPHILHGANSYDDVISAVNQEFGRYEITHNHEFKISTVIMDDVDLVALIKVI